MCGARGELGALGRQFYCLNFARQAGKLRRGEPPGGKEMLKSGFVPREDLEIIPTKPARVGKLLTGNIIRRTRSHLHFTATLLALVALLPTQGKAGQTAR